MKILSHHCSKASDGCSQVSDENQTARSQWVNTHMGAMVADFDSNDCGLWSNEIGFVHAQKVRDGFHTIQFKVDMHKCKMKHPSDQFNYW